MINVNVPHTGWLPRDHQEPLWKYLVEDEGKRAMAVWHRRAGKDEVALHHTFTAMVKRVGSYWHCLPEYEQARKAIWTSVNAHTGIRRIDEVFPENFRDSCDEGKMFIRLKNGSTWQCIGSDNYSATVGAGVAGIVYSEWALANPSAWAYHRPMVEENNGWATFITTPRGRNHAHALYHHARKSPEWFCELLTVDDTHALTPEALTRARDEYCALYGEDAGRAAYMQEYFCDWTAAVLGAVYSREMAEVRREDRILDIEAPPDHYVHRAWDLGVKNDTAIWWFVVSGGQILILDCLAQSGVGVEWFADEIRKREAQHGWLHGTDFVPHDAKVKEWGSGRTRVEIMQSIGLRPLLVPMASIQDGVQAVRRTLPLCVFHPRCEAGDFSGISAMEQHHREWDDEKKTFRANAVDDWTSHFADAFRYLALSWRHAPRREVPEPKLEGFVIPPPPEPRQGGLRV
jgi:phage terminase large subunit